ncbi:hypothetical protein ZIOFF_013766 [Zingiber officinale]|uniref:Protein kinase domain-containing protein n=1 Tax=Zingiber officinale TaxID=94328 RepID=A0A8J5HSB3_ZINOF|nr:hypothetical protein ZIOFF_013766 [Zingiber officinale]
MMRRAVDLPNPRFGDGQRSAPTRSRERRGCVGSEEEKISGKMEVARDSASANLGHDDEIRRKEGCADGEEEKRGRKTPCLGREREEGGSAELFSLHLIVLKVYSVPSHICISVVRNALICPTGNEKECYGAIPIPMSFNINNDSPGTILFQFRELQIATNGFSSKNSLCKGGFGIVYKGKLQDRTLVAVKRLNDGNAAGGEIQFKAEVEMISLAIHRHILRLCGFCMTATEKLLVYPYIKANSRLEYEEKNSFGSRSLKLLVR